MRKIQYSGELKIIVDNYDGKCGDECPFLESLTVNKSVTRRCRLFGSLEGCKYGTEWGRSPHCVDMFHGGDDD